MISASPKPNETSMNDTIYYLFPAIDIFFVHLLKTVTRSVCGFGKQFDSQIHMNLHTLAKIVTKWILSSFGFLKSLALLSSLAFLVFYSSTTYNKQIQLVCL